MADAERSKSLTPVELAAVLRRAAELDAESPLPVPVDGIDPLVVEAAAIEAGLSPQAVRRALAEVMHPDETVPDAYRAGGGLLPGRELVLVREVPGRVDDVDERIARFLHQQLFQQQRIFADGSRWGPRRGLAANIKREINPKGRLALTRIEAVTVSVTPINDGGDADEGATPDDRVLVRIGLDLSGVRAVHRAWLTGGVVTGAAAVGTSAAIFGIDPLVLASLPVAGGLTAGGHFVGRWSAQSEVEKVHTAVAGLLDRLEHPDRERPGRRFGLPGSGSRGTGPRGSGSRER